MDLEQALSTLRAHEADLKARGVLHAAVFGSVARGDAGPSSDLDVLIDLDPDRQLDLFAYASLKLYIGELFGDDDLGQTVDVANRKTLKPLLREPVTAEAIVAF